MTLATYRIGPATRPNIVHDNGFLDQFTRRAPTVADRAKYAGWWAVLEGAEAVQRVPGAPHNDISDALAAYRHFLEGSGRQRTFSYERYVANDASGRTTLNNALVEVRGAAIDLYRTFHLNREARFEFTGSALSAGSSSAHFPYPATENWQKAIGAHNFWLSGSVEVTLAGTTPEFALVATLHAEDMYNFNPGAEDITTGIPDGANGIFEVTGLARQYLNVATLTRYLTWSGLAPATMQVATSASRWARQDPMRTRQPDDNRRIRNRT
ncbi:MAG: hypothetical protein JNM13_14155 [Hyphomicrobiaceae bacterium]|nr:hypothetical protein [Hyphomicrobiaceae bacterium]